MNWDSGEWAIWNCKELYLVVNGCSLCMYVCDLSLSIYIISVYPYLWVSLVAQMVKNLPEMQETWVWSLNWEDSLEKGMATHSSILAWRIPWTKKPGRLQSMGLQRVGYDWASNTHIFLYALFHYYVYFCLSLPLAHYPQEAENLFIDVTHRSR